MKRAIRIMAAALCIALLLSCYPVNMFKSEALADDVFIDLDEISGDGEETKENPSGDAPTPQEGTIVETSDEETDQSLFILGDGSEETESITDVNFELSVARNPNFHSGYAVLKVGFTPVYHGDETDAYAELGEGTVFVPERDNPKTDRIRIYFNNGTEIEGVLIAAKDIRPLDPKSETPGFLELCAQTPGALSKGEISLLPIEWRKIESETEEVYQEEEPAYELLAIPEEPALIEEDIDETGISVLEILLAEDVEEEKEDEILTESPDDGLTMAFACSSVKIGKGDNKLRLKVLFSDGSDHPVSFSTGNAKYVTVNDDGYVKGVNVGTTTVTANCTEEGLEGIAADCTVKVCKPITKSAQIKSAIPASLKLSIGDEASVMPNFGTYAVSCDFKSADESIVTVGEFGVVKAVGKGETSITVSSKLNSKINAKCKVQVWQQATSVSLDMPERLGVGMSTTLGAIFESFETDGVSYWAEPAEGNVSIDGDKLTALKENETVRITVQTDGGFSDTKELRILPAPNALVKNAGTIKLGKGNSYDIFRFDAVGLDPADSMTELVYSSSNKKVATVSAKGVIKAVAVGKATITVKDKANKLTPVKLSVQVLKSAKSMTLSPAAMKLGMDMKGKLNVKFPSGCYDYYWIDSYDSACISVDSNGNVTPLSPGQTDIVIKTLGNKTKVCTANIYKTPVALDMTGELRIGKGDKQHSLAATSGEDEYCTVRYRSLNGNIATVNATSGLINAVAPGTVMIEAYNANDPEGNYTAIAQCALTVVGAPTKVSCSSGTSLKLGKGDKYDLSENIVVTWKDGNEGDAIVKYATSDKSIVSVDSKGVLTAKKVGTAKIKASVYNGKNVVVTVKVQKAATKVTLTPSDEEIGELMKGTVKATFPRGTYSVLRYYSDTPELLSVNEKTGAYEAGETDGICEAMIYAVAGGDTIGQCTVKVYPAPSGIEFTSEGYEVREGGTCETAIAAYPQDACIGSYRFESSQPEIATVDESGVITGHLSGTATITAYAQKGAEATCTVEVTPYAQKVVFDEGTAQSYVIAKGDTVSLPLPKALDARGNVLETAFKYSSSNTKYVRMSDDEAKGVAAGTANISIKAADYPEAKAATLKLKVSSSVITGVTLDKTSVTLYMDAERGIIPEPFQLKAGFKGGITLGSVRFTSSDDTIATVDENGVVECLSTGSVKIKATSFNGKYATCTLNIVKLSSTLDFTEKLFKLAEGDKCRLEPVFEEGTGADITYTFLDPGIASVDADGGVTALSIGMTYIEATGAGGLYQRVEIRVLPGPDALKVPTAHISMNLTDSFTFVPRCVSDQPEGEFIDRLTFKSGSSNVASIDEKGVVTPHKVGVAIVTATAVNGVSVSCTIHVVKDQPETGFTFGDTATIVCGDSADLSDYIILASQDYSAAYELMSGDPDKLSVNGFTVKACENTSQPVTLSLSTALGETVCEADVAIVSGLSLSWSVNGRTSISRLELRQYTPYDDECYGSDLVLLGLPADLIGTFSIRSTDEDVVYYDSENLRVEADILTASIHNDDPIAASAQLIASCYNREKAAVLDIDILPIPRYYALLISEYNGTGGSKRLKFAGNNINFLGNALSASCVYGQSYSIKHLKNPSKSAIASGIKDKFKNATANDVCLLYILTHGHKGYKMSLANGTYVTSAEIRNSIKDVKGNLVFFVDSCYSGGFIEDCSDAGFFSSHPKVSVLSCQDSTHRGTFMWGSTSATNTEFGTFAFTEGLGYGELIHVDSNLKEIKDTSKSFAYYIMKGRRSSVKADTDENGFVSIKAALSYVQQEAPKLLKTVWNKQKQYVFPETTSKAPACSPMVHGGSNWNKIVLYG